MSKHSGYPLRARCNRALAGVVFATLGKDLSTITSIANLTTIQYIQRELLMDLYPRLGEGYRLKTLFKEYLEMEEPEQAKAFLAYGCDLATDSKIQPFMDAAKSRKAHWS